RALDVPARPPAPPRRVPPGVLVRFVGLPQREVERVLLVLAGLDPRLELVDALARELPVMIVGANAEIDVAGGLVGPASSDQLLDQSDNLGHHLGRPRLL